MEQTIQLCRTIVRHIGPQIGSHRGVFHLGSDAPGSGRSSRCFSTRSCSFGGEGYGSFGGSFRGGLLSMAASLLSPCLSRTAITIWNISLSLSLWPPYLGPPLFLGPSYLGASSLSRASRLSLAQVSCLWASLLLVCPARASSLSLRRATTLSRFLSRIRFNSSILLFRSLSVRSRKVICCSRSLDTLL